MGIGTWTEVKRFESQDGKRRLMILSNSEKMFRYTEETLVTEDGYTWWNPSYGSGLYDSIEAVERDARAERSWMRTEDSN